MSNATPSAKRLRLDRPVVLVGLMGVGKSTIGRRLAAAMGCRFVDSDEEIERAADRSVAEIFEMHGEAYFRDGERRVIARLLDEGCGVIATGGGAFMDAETRALVLDKGIAVWLDCELDTLVRRTARKDTRPLLKTGDPRAILGDLKARRDSAYAQSPIHVRTDTGPHERAVDLIMRELAIWQ